LRIHFLDKRRGKKSQRENNKTSAVLYIKNHKKDGKKLQKKGRIPKRRGKEIKHTTYGGT
jgi:hypothetical protein